MLIALTRERFEQLVPLAATAAQYKYCWGQFPDFLRRLLISISGAFLGLLIESVVDNTWKAIYLPVWIASGFYFLWAPVFWASWRNYNFRKLRYAGFWRGRVLDVFISEELVGKPEETVNNRGELVIVENRERCLNLEVGDASGFVRRLQVPLKPEHRAIAPGQIAEMLVTSRRADLSRIEKTSDVFIPSQETWVSDYPYVQQDMFEATSRKLRQVDDERFDRRDRQQRRREKSRRQAASKRKATKKPILSLPPQRSNPSSRP